MSNETTGHDRLGVLSSTRAVIDASTWVEIDHDRIEALARDFAERAVAPEPWASPYHFADGTARTVTAVFVLDALNFCFWSERADPADRWKVAYNGEVVDGYWALAAALKRGIEAGAPLYDPAYLATISASDLEELLRPSVPGGARIPLFNIRLANLQELGRGLLAIGGAEPATTLVTDAGGSAIELVQRVVSLFPSFNDVATYHGQDVRFYKRAQILISDLAGAFAGAGFGAFHDFGDLTAFADYKVPQVLRQLGVLRYASELAERISARELLRAGSEEEVEIRAATIWGVEYLRRALAAHGRSLPAGDIDWLLWQAGQHLPPGTEPYHRTLTVFY
ncbi:MAG: queuosine 5'-phosphate N-glycosylase/hydrolase [Thermomicrobiales bacterium]